MTKSRRGGGGRAREAYAVDAMGGIIGRTALSWRPPEALRRSEEEEEEVRRGQERGIAREVCRPGREGGRGRRGR